MLNKSRAVKAPKVTIKIPQLLYHNLPLIADNSGFDSVTDVVVDVLRDLVAQAANDPNAMIIQDKP